MQKLIELLGPGGRGGGGGGVVLGLCPHQWQKQTYAFDIYRAALTL